MIWHVHLTSIFHFAFTQSNMTHNYVIVSHQVPTAVCCPDHQPIPGIRNTGTQKQAACFFKRFIVKIFKKGVVLGVGDGNAGRQDFTYVTHGVKHQETDN